MQKIALTIILVISALLRFWDIQNTPRGLYIDEISIGWNTYLISTTARDEYNQFLPIAFRAFGEYKLPGYIYATIPVFWLFGPGIWQLRFISALTGVFASLGIYLLTKELLSSVIPAQAGIHLQDSKAKILKKNVTQITGDQNNSTVDSRTLASIRDLRGNDANNGQHKNHIALTAALLFAITPWSIHLSRAAFEANLALTTSLFALYFLLKLRNRVGKKPKNFIRWFCIFYFAFSFYTYNAARLILPLLFGITILIWFKDYSRKTIIMLCSFILLVSLPGIIGFSTGGENVRAQQVLEFGHQKLELGPFMGTLYKYLDHFSADFLFFKGDPVGRHGVRELGVLLMPLILLLPLGLYVVARSVVLNNQETNHNNQIIINKQSSIFILAVLLFAPIPSAIATPAPHALRAIYMLPTLIIVSSIGIVYFFEKISNSKNQITNKFKLLNSKNKTFLLFDISSLFRIYNLLFHISFYSFTFFIFCYSLLTYHHVYYTHWSPIMWPEWSEHWTKGAQYIAQNYPDTPKVIMEESTLTKYYLQFFDAVEGNTIEREFIGIDHVYKVYDQINDGDIVAIAGWKETPPQLTNVYEVIAANQNKDVIYKVGVWQGE